MPDIVRFSVSLENDLLGQFDSFCTEGKFATRSEAVRHLIREKLVSSQSTDKNSHVAASLTLVYDHHKTKITDKLLDLQHAHSESVVSSMHVHLDDDLCMELIALRGHAGELQNLADALGGLKGVHHAKLVFACSQSISPLHLHSHQHPHKHTH